QLWWGHRVPVWYDADGVAVASRTELRLGDPHPKTGKPITRQDPDVLDTWASSWLWPFATLGWPDLTDDLQRFYPTQFLSTARDILYLWVARMVMAGYEFQDHLPESQRCPFETCYVHATVLDAKGRRMSKSLGNGIDPIEMIDKYGADAVRYSLILLTKEGQDVKLSPDRFEQGWRFGNKVWNAARFVLMNLEGERGAGTSASAQLLEDRWILSRLAATRAEVSLALEEHRYNEAASELYRFVWNDFCDWYLEIVKPRMLSKIDPTSGTARGVLARVLGDSLALLHPFTPYMTEVLAKALDERLGRSAPMLMNAKWPDGAGIARDEAAEAEMETIQGLVRAVRSLRLLTEIPERKPLKAKVAAPRAGERTVLTKNAPTVQALAFLEPFEVAETVERQAGWAPAVAGSVEVFVQLEGEVDFEKLRESLARRCEKLKSGLAACDAKLANAAFVERADPQIVEDERARRAEMAAELALLERILAGFN
ncbi:MAG: class I tRNA ligase family protein, partial [Planctomycetota bacterium]